MDLSRIARGGTPIQLDRPRLLLYDMAAVWALLQHFGTDYLSALYGPAPLEEGEQESNALVLRSMDALCFYLWVGLLADAKLRNEDLTLEQVETFITPATYPTIFNTVIHALFRNTFSPAEPDEAGKAEAAAAGPAVAAKAPRPRRSTSRKRNASAAASSAGRPTRSGQPRSRKSTSRAKATSRAKRRAAKKPPTG